MLKEFIDRLVALAPASNPAAILEIGDRKYVDKGGTVTKTDDPSPVPVKLQTLSGFRDALEALVADDMKAGYAAHVSDHLNVLLIGRGVNEWARRETLIHAICGEEHRFNFGQFMEHEQFIIGLQANFVRTDDREYLLRIASNLTADMVTTSDDDGIAQQVGQRAGVTLKATEQVRSRVALAPFRTFREVEQPASEFVFRVRHNGEKVPQCALFEADGGAWKLAATESVARWLRSGLKTDVPVIA